MSDDDGLVGGLLDALSSEDESPTKKKSKDDFLNVKAKLKRKRELIERKKASPAFGVTKQLPRTTWPKGKTDVERFSRLRIKNRKVSAEEMERNMVGRTFFAMRTLKSHRKTLLNEDAENLDWVTVGVLAEKSKPRLTTSAKNGMPRKYSIWTLDDLDGTSVTLFLHRLAYGTFLFIFIGAKLKHTQTHRKTLGRTGRGDCRTRIPEMSRIENRI